MATLELVKYHALGNDFLVVLPGSGGGGEDVEVGPAAARALCARRTGVGADGVIVLHRGGRLGAAATMELRNADGGLAETSGNGVRCAALAALDAGLLDGPELLIDTPAGPAPVVLLERGAGGGVLSVAMGRAEVGELRSGVLGRFARRVTVGNPHLVLHPAPGATSSGALPALRAGDLAALEHGVDGEVPGGLNVESAVPIGASPAAPGFPRAGGKPPEGDGDVVELVVWERGAGETLACGSGSVAAAAALRAAGLVGDRVEVRNPGGTLHVELSGPSGSPQATLTGPAHRVARLEVDLDELARTGAGEAVARS